MKLEIWSDVVCPWCYIGKSRVEKALADFPHEVEVEWHSFQLDPGAPSVPVETVAQALGRKYGGGEAAGRQMIDRVEAVAAEEGMIWRHNESLRVGTVDAHRLLHLALAEGGTQLQGALKQELFAAYFERAANVADHDVLRKLAATVGLDAGRVDEVLASSAYLDEVYADQQRAGAYGATGVPFAVIDSKFGVSGAQPVDVLRQILDRAWADAHPKLEILADGVDGGDACGPDGCAI